MFMLPFLTIPYSTVMLAYQNTHFKIPIAFLRSESSSTYQQMITETAQNSLNTEIKPFFEQQGIRKDLLVLEMLNFSIFTSMGTNRFRQGDAIIKVLPGFKEVDKHSYSWLIKHEIGHIKNNDNFTIPLVAAICSTTAAIFATIMLPIIPAILITIAVGLIAQGIFSQYREGKADDFAIANSSVDELKGGRRFMMSVQEVNKAKRKTLWNKLMGSSSGEDRLDYLHPSIASRLKKIERALEQKKVSIDEAEETKKIEPLTVFITKTNSQIESEVKKLGFFRMMMIQSIQQINQLIPTKKS